MLESFREVGVFGGVGRERMRMDFWKLTGSQKKEKKKKKEKNSERILSNEV